MMRGMLQGAAIGLGALVMLASPALARNDLRQFRVGMSVSQLPATGYDGFACADAPNIRLDGWSGYAKCPKDALGLHPVAFRYEPSSNPRARLNDEVHGTRVAGHPVLLALLIADGGEVAGLNIATDPKAHPYLRKKAFLFAHQVRVRYGTAGWKCEDAKPHGGEVPIAGVFIDRTCEKRTAARRIMLREELFRRAGAPLKDFVSATEVTVLAR